MIFLDLLANFLVRNVNRHECVNVAQQRKHTLLNRVFHCCNCTFSCFHIKFSFFRQKDHLYRLRLVDQPGLLWYVSVVICICVIS